MRRKHQSSYITPSKVCVQCTVLDLSHHLNENRSGFVFLFISSSTLTIQKAFFYLCCPRTQCQHTHTHLVFFFFWLSDNTKLSFIFSEPATHWLFCLELLDPDQCKHGTFSCYLPGMRHLLSSAVLRSASTWFLFWASSAKLCMWVSAFLLMCCIKQQPIYYQVLWVWELCVSCVC